METKQINRNEVKKLNQKQTILIETITSDGKVETNIYLGNFRKRSEAYYDCYVAGEFKPVRKGDVTKSYRLLKLFKFIAETANNDQKKNPIHYFKLEAYKADPVKEVKAEATEAQAEEATEVAAEVEAPIAE